MTWNYRIVKSKEGWFGLHEVFYNKNGEAWGATVEPISFSSYDKPSDIISSMSMALADILAKPVLEEPEQWAERDGAEES